MHMKLELLNLRGKMNESIRSQLSKRVHNAATKNQDEELDLLSWLISIAKAGGLNGPNASYIVDTLQTKKSPKYYAMGLVELQKAGLLDGSNGLTYCKIVFENPEGDTEAYFAASGIATLKKAGLIEEADVQRPGTNVYLDIVLKHKHPNYAAMSIELLKNTDLLNRRDLIEDISRKENPISYVRTYTDPILVRC